MKYEVRIRAKIQERRKYIEIETEKSILGEDNYFKSCLFIRVFYIKRIVMTTIYFTKIIIGTNLHS